MPVGMSAHGMGAGAITGAASGSMFGPWGTAIGAGVGALSSLAGGLIGSNTQQKLTRQQIDLQREFATHGIRMRVEDAKLAGIHPAAALGAFPVSANPIIMEDPLGRSVAQAGQDISGAVSRMQTSEERINARLTNELLASQIRENDARTQAIASDSARKATETGPAFPIINSEPTPLDGQTGTKFPPGTGMFNTTIPNRFASSFDGSYVESGVSPGFEKVTMPWGEMELPSGRGQEAPQEIWNSTSEAEKFAIIMHNIQKKGMWWGRDYLNFRLTGRPAQGANQKPFFDDYKSRLGSDDEIWKQIQDWQKIMVNPRYEGVKPYNRGRR